MTNRRAFSLVELLVALVLLAVGLAACARAAGAVARLENAIRLRRTVADIVLARLDTLAVLPCTSAAEGVTTSAGVAERWNASSDGRRWSLHQRVSVPSRPALSRTYDVVIACAR